MSTAKKETTGGTLLVALVLCIVCSVIVAGAAAGFRVETVDLDAIEAAGGSLRCCIGEIF